MPEYAPPIAHYAHVNVADMPQEAILRAIGKQGRHFIRLTESLRLDYIWWNKDTRVVEIWGSHRAVSKGLNRVKKHLYRFC